MAAPINDNLADAIEIISFGIISGTTIDATTDAEGYENSEWTGADTPSVWYKWTNPGADFDLEIRDLDGDSPGFDPEGPEIDIFTYPGTPTDFLDLITVGDYLNYMYAFAWQPFDNIHNRFTFTVPSGTTLYLWVANYAYDDTGQGNFSFSLDIPLPPVNTVSLSFRQAE